jgi:hypothetical protein
LDWRLLRESEGKRPSSEVAEKHVHNIHSFTLINIADEKPSTINTNPHVQ